MAFARNRKIITMAYSPCYPSLFCPFNNCYMMTLVTGLSFWFCVDIICFYGIIIIEKKAG